jgi:guanylate kinase
VPDGPVLVVLTGPSGVGKDSLLLALKQAGFATSVNATTRAPRPGEVDGVDYLFVSKREFARMVATGELLEHAVVYDQEKGVPKSPVRKLLEDGRDVILRTDVQGARHIKSVVPGALTIFVAPPSAEELERRLLDRGGDSSGQIEVRVRTARDEMEAASEFDHVVVNDDLQHCVDEIKLLIERERSRSDRLPLRIP